MASLHRAGDAVITVCQNNAARLITIHGLNPAAESITGFSNEELMNAPLSWLLPSRINDTIKDYVEFSENANDVANVLGKVREFALRTSDGLDKPFRLKIIRSEAEDNHWWFKMILQDEVAQRQNEAVRHILQENFRGHEVLDKATGLPDKESLKKDIEILLHPINSHGLQASFAVMQIDGYDELLSNYGRVTCNRLLVQLASICRQSLREGDTVGSLWYNELGLILVDTPADAARMVLNRLRWKIASRPISLGKDRDFGITISVSYSLITSDTAEGLIERCEKQLEALHEQGGNLVAEVPVV